MRAASSLSAGISWIVPKSAGNVIPSAVWSRPPRLPRRLPVVKVRQLHVGGDEPDLLELVQGGPDDREDLTTT